MMMMIDNLSKRPTRTHATPLPLRARPLRAAEGREGSMSVAIHGSGLIIVIIMMMMITLLPSRNSIGCIAQYGKAKHTHTYTACAAVDPAHENKSPNALCLELLHCLCPLTIVSLSCLSFPRPFLRSIHAIIPVAVPSDTGEGKDRRTERKNKSRLKRLDRHPRPRTLPTHGLRVPPTPFSRPDQVVHDGRL